MTKQPSTTERSRITRVLVANRGEIAVRIIHACHESGRVAVAVYADDDADALFVHLADEAYSLEGDSPKDTYLDIERLIGVGTRVHADAVHPGYGFLSENADFAQAVIDAGMVWIGPRPDSIRLLGDKVRARRVAAEVGAPMAPGTTEPVDGPSDVIRFAREHGLPLAIKAVHGGGGKGLKVVTRVEDIRNAYLSATREAKESFGDGECFIERFLDRPRHVEVQVLGDLDGHVIAVGTRDCSLQRRNQKLIEEAPAPFLDEGVSGRLCGAAVAICSHVGYVGAGTVEFLMDPDGTMSFMEVNTRIQVEHAVTEEVAGIDLVKAQFDIAEGACVDGMDIKGHGHAMEFRINAEDPAHGFVPFPGRIDGLRVPSGPGIRFDTGIETGSVVSGRFDSLLAKLIVVAPDRSSCVSRAKRALAELEIEGVPTVAPFDRAVLEDDDFVSDDHLGVYTRWIEESFLSRTDVDDLRGPDPRRDPGADAVTRTWIEIDGRRREIGIPSRLLSSARNATHAEGDGGVSDGSSSHRHGDIVATLTGTVTSWLVGEGSRVEMGQPVATLEAMKMETQVTAPLSGSIHRTASIGDLVDFGGSLGHIE
ncbi:biotin carboxylase N-terminal domain-containing protein [uncultured Bifidobacterium sp.]|uniref:acetyl/propionyl/methylcrotonyl-CoA carboxylase subunit alpha n=1 Tax=uncultured Bifidobacterium sp. TaxID=165187 RepID=UPI002620194A|nr:biotin carboxylase N-terminal domain-containing protein [uncultured Bifidobacterium sp.]